MMKKNCFNFKKAMTSVMMLSMVSFTMTSCDDFWDDLFGTPSDPPTETPSEPEDDGSVTLTATGATLKVEKLSDITELLNQIKSDIASKVGQEYVVEIVGEGLKATSDDNTINVPKVEKSNINLSFANALTTEVPLLVKAAESESKTSVECVNALTITLPASKGLSIEIDMPETSVTLKEAESKAIDFEEVVSTTALNALYIESGVTVKNLQVKDGIVVVKDGGKAETYVYAPDNNETILKNNELGVIPLPVKDASNRERYNVETENGNAYLFKSVKIIKGSAEYASIDFWNSNNDVESPIELTIAEGVTVKSGYRPYVKTIEGEGSGAELTIQYWPGGPFEDENGKTFIIMSGYLDNVTKMKGISLSIEPFTTEGEEILASVDSVSFTLYNIPSDVENCTFKYDHIMFKEGEATTNSIKNCRFEAPNMADKVIITVPTQSETLPSYKLSFEDCDFSEGLKFITDIGEWAYVYDDNGERIWWTYWNYWDSEGFHQVASQSEIPEGVESDGPHEGWKTTNVELNNYNVTIAFSNCKLGGNAFTHPLDFISAPITGNKSNQYIPRGAHLKYEIDGKTYEAVWDSESGEGGYYFVED